MITSRRAWLVMLARLVVPVGADPEPAVAALADMLPLLNDFPDAAFSVDSLDAVATRCKFVPNYAQLREYLGSYWRAHMPQHTAIAGRRVSASEQQEALEGELRQSWRDATPGWVREKVRQLQDGNPMNVALQNILVTALARHGQHHLGLLPPEWLERNAEQLPKRGGFVPDA